VLFAASAQAVPIAYFQIPTTGQVTITATVGGAPVAGPVTLGLTGSLVRVDEDTLELNRIQLATGSSGAIPIAPPYLGFTSINLDFANLLALNGTISEFDPGPPSGYDYSIDNVLVSGQFDATNVIPAESLTDQPFGFLNPTASGTIYVETNVALVLDGITIGQIDPDGPGGVDPLVLKGDFIFEGQVPEPGTAMLLALGLAGIAARGRRG
jgi:hypothetical protein